MQRTNLEILRSEEPANPEVPRYAHGSQAQRDEEIEAIQQHSRHQHPGMSARPSFLRRRRAKRCGWSPWPCSSC